MIRPPPSPPLFPYPPLSRSSLGPATLSMRCSSTHRGAPRAGGVPGWAVISFCFRSWRAWVLGTVRLHDVLRSEEHTSELPAQSNLVCRLLLEKQKTNLYLSS